MISAMFNAALVFRSFRFSRFASYYRNRTSSDTSSLDPEELFDDTVQKSGPHVSVPQTSSDFRVLKASSAVFSNAYGQLNDLQQSLTTSRSFPDLTQTKIVVFEKPIKTSPVSEIKNAFSDSVSDSSLRLSKTFPDLKKIISHSDEHLRDKTKRSSRIPLKQQKISEIIGCQNPEDLKTTSKISKTFDFSQKTPAVDAQNAIKTLPPLSVLPHQNSESNIRPLHQTVSSCNTDLKFEESARTFSEKIISPMDVGFRFQNLMKVHYRLYLPVLPLGCVVQSRCIHLSRPLKEDVRTVQVPQLAESLNDGDIHWLKSKGDKVSKDEVIGEIETDKVNIPVQAPESGVIEELLVEDGANVKEGAGICKIRLE